MLSWLQTAFPNVESVPDSIRTNSNSHWRIYSMRCLGRWFQLYSNSRCLWSWPFFDKGDSPSSIFDSSLFNWIDVNKLYRIIGLALKEKQNYHTVIRKNVTDFKMTITEIIEVIDQGKIDTKSIDKTHPCFSSIFSALILIQRVMLIV